MQKLLKSNSTDVTEIKKLFAESKGNDSEKKTSMEHALRDLIMKTYFTDMEMVEKLIEISIAIAKIDCILPYQPVTLLVDVFDTNPLESCEKLFNYVENNVNVFKEGHFFTPCKNNLLRMCNDLLRRLSRSQNTVFCGRILLFLAKFFPFSERSGLNIISEFNVENTTEYGTEEADQTTTEETSMKVDSHLYTKFWSLQEFFRCPNICYDQAQWKKFTSYSKEILSAFKSFKLEDTALMTFTDVEMKSPTKEKKADTDNFFAKFLTNPKLLSLQLSDSNFRRTILVQYLILLQYLCATVKFKSDKDQLTATQLEWVQETETLIYKLLSETPPNGKEFVESVRHLLKREEMWNSWKNDSCKEIQRPEGNKTEAPPTKKQKLLGDVIADATKAGKFELGNSELNRLWNLCPDNLQACKGSDRNFLPPLETYLEPPKDTSDPAYEWRALRLVSRQSIHFFTNFASPTPNEKVEKISDYLRLFHQKIQKDKGEIKHESSNASVEIQMEQNDQLEETGEIDDGDSQDQNDHKKKVATPEQIVAISKALGSDWQILGQKLALSPGK